MKGTGLVVDAVPDVFFGYYNFDVNDGPTGDKYGMLSLNGSSVRSGFTPDTEPLFRRKS